jgi:hypothetical protein
MSPKKNTATTGGYSVDVQLGCHHCYTGDVVFKGVFQLAVISGDVSTSTAHVETERAISKGNVK